MLSRVPCIIVLIFGLFIAVLSPVVVHYLLMTDIREKGERLVNSIAMTMIERADKNMLDAIDILSDFSLRGIETCRPSDINAIKRALSRQFWIKELGVVGSDGNFICNQFGDESKFVERTKGVRGEHGNILINNVKRKDSDGFETMLTWKPESSVSLGAVLPGEALANDVIPKAMREKGVALVMAADGSLMHMAPSQNTARSHLPLDTKTFQTSLHSESFPFYVTVLASHDVIWGSEHAFYTRSMFAASAIGLIFFVLYLRITWPFKTRVNEIEKAIDAGEFIAFYQPTVNLQTGALEGCEVLIRWRKPDGTILAPKAFIGMAEVTGLAVPMTRCLMKNVVEEMEDLHETRPDLKLGINLFDNHFENLDIIGDIKEIFGKSKIRYSQLMFEVTERQPLSDIDRARTVIRNMRSLGCKVALDDTGTGHCGLAYLHQLGLDVIKIDKLFIDGIGTQSPSAPIIDSLVSLAESLDMEVVAEGVEEQRQLDYLREKGVPQAQGYLFAKPLPADAYAKLIQKLVPSSKNFEEKRFANSLGSNVLQEKIA